MAGRRMPGEPPGHVEEPVCKVGHLIGSGPLVNARLTSCAIAWPQAFGLNTGLQGQGRQKCPEPLFAGPPSCRRVVGYSDCARPAPLLPCGRDLCSNSL